MVLVLQLNSKRMATILQEVIKNQVASLKEFREAYPPSAEAPPEPEYPVDHNFVEALNVVLQEQQQVDAETTAQFVDCQEELNNSDEKRRGRGRRRLCQ